MLQSFRGIRLVHQIQRARLARGFASFPGVDGQYSRSGDSEAENLSLDLNKNSLLHAMVLSVDVLTGSDIVMVKKVEESFDINTRAAAVVPQHQIYDRSKEIEGVTDIKTKYMKKLASKLPGQSLDQIHSAKGNPKGSAKGDGEMFRVGQALSKSDEAKAKAALAWMLVPGMGALLDYCHHRTMKIGVISTFKTDDAHLRSFCKTMDIPFDVILHRITDPPQPPTLREKTVLANVYLQGILNNPNFKTLQAKQIMLVTGCDALLGAAKDLGFFTVKYRHPEGLYGQVSTDFMATSALEVQDALEELNGVALRSSAFSHRSF